jgi:hypothetical protein
MSAIFYYISAVTEHFGTVDTLGTAEKSLTAKVAKKKTPQIAFLCVLSGTS